MNVFAKDRRGIPKTVRITPLQRQVIDLLTEIRGTGSSATDVILDALDMYTEATLRRNVPEDGTRANRRLKAKIEQLQALVSGQPIRRRVRPTTTQQPV